MSLVPTLDRFDRRILEILQQDALTSQKEIGRRVALSTAAVNRRIRRMQDEGVITASVCVVAPERVGRAVTVIVGLAVTDERPKPLQQTKAALAAAPEVQQCYYVTGDYDLFVVLTVESMAEYQALTQSLFMTDGNIARFKTFVVMDRVKATLTCPV